MRLSTTLPPWSAAAATAAPTRSVSASVSASSSKTFGAGAEPRSLLTALRARPRQKPHSMKMRSMNQTGAMMTRGTRNCPTTS